jgi:hypothetical protein
MCRIRTIVRKRGWGRAWTICSWVWSIVAIAALVFKVLVRFISVAVMLSCLYRNHGKCNEDSYYNKKKKSNR